MSKQADGNDATDPGRRQSSLFCASELIRSLQEPASFWRAFKSVKFDSDDGAEYEGERIIVIVARAEAAERISDAYDAVVADLPEGDRDAIR